MDNSRGFQVRCLVATAVLAARTAPGDNLALLRRATSGDQRQTAPAAPALGLCLAEAGYEPWAKVAVTEAPLR